MNQTRSSPTHALTLLIVLGIGVLAIGCSKSSGVEYDFVLIAADDAEMNAAVAKAHESFSDFGKQFALANRDTTQFFVRRPYKDKDNIDYVVYIHVSEYKDGMITGSVDEEPMDVPNLKQGQQVTFPAAEIVDLQVVQPDGTVEGCLTDKIQERRGG